ncbi:ABC transporter permease [Paenibacillus athensensis]|uniref:ABC transporter permease n=1 Tax=Paenibacillus athensensis TaxID=1967502 RepID=A0A4Y8PWU9_9BACL|nr:ABC transporter permease [Paenibacillus athensensis]MCD1259421.1 ABC transporter permease [Paenibacillus athensensis]
MSAYRQLTLAQLRIFARNRQVLFWSLGFPIFFMIMLGSFLGNGSSLSLGGTVIDLDSSPSSTQLVAALTQSQALKLTTATDEPKALDELKNGDSQMVVVIPQGYGEAVTKAEGGGETASVKAYFDETNLTTLEVGKATLGQVVDGISKQLTHYKPVIGIQAEGVQALHLKYIDFLVPGIVAMMIMSNNLNGVAGQIASWRERGILRRLQSTTLKPGTFIAAQITARLVMNGLQAVIVLLVGALIFHTQVNGSWLLLLFFVILGTLAFMSIGFIVASLAKTPESAGPIAGFISFPMLFVGGVFFPIKDMPAFLQPIVKLLPISHLTSALRQVMNVGVGFTGVWQEALLLAGWMIVAFLIASFTFKWE